MEQTPMAVARQLNLPKLKKDKRTLQGRVYEHVRREIIRGTLKWGERLSEDSLACSFNVSRTPVREAIFRLVQEGLVTKEPHNCFYVRKFTRADIEEIFHLRSVLEPLVLEMLFEKIDDGVIAELQDNLNQCQRFLQQGDIDQALRLAAEFHEIIYRVGASPKLRAILRGLGGDVLLNRYLAVQKEGVLADFIDHHRQMLDALIAKDKALVEKTMREHLEEGRNCAIEIVDPESHGNGQRTVRSL
ncbi:MAG: GntR family transcriptional regulator [Desulfobaccales bacterium]